MSVCRVLVMAAVVSQGGCSYFLVDGPPPQSTIKTIPSCDRSSAWMVGDWIFAGGNFVAVWPLLLDSEPDGTAALLAATWAALFGGSAVIGHLRTSRCRAAHRRFRDGFVNPDRAPPATLPAAPAPAVDCGPLIRAWQHELLPERRDERFAALPASCRAELGNLALPFELERDAIAAGLASVSGFVDACEAQYPAADGAVRLAIVVEAAGEVSGVTVEQTPDDGLGGCLAAAVRSARFAPTRQGGSFTHVYYVTAVEP